MPLGLGTDNPGSEREIWRIVDFVCFIRGEKIMLFSLIWHPPRILLVQRYCRVFVGHVLLLRNHIKSFVGGEMVDGRGV